MTPYEQTDDPEPIDLTAMIDVIFLLLIFWMTVARITGEPDPAAVDVPRTDSARVVDLPMELLTVELARGANDLLVGTERMSLEGLVKSLERGPMPRHVMVRAKADEEANAVQTVLAALATAGIKQVGLAVRGIDE